MICKIEMIDARVFEKAWIAQNIENRELKKLKLFQNLIYKHLRGFCLKLLGKNLRNFLKISQILCSFQVGLRKSVV